MRSINHQGSFLRTEIYYFTGTGNSLAVARDLAGKLGGDLIPIPAVMDRSTIITDASWLGIVFPVYHGGLPIIIWDFVRQLVGLERKYLFAICTYGDEPGLAMEYLAKEIKMRGGKLSAGFAVHMPYNYVTPSSKGLSGFTLREIPIEKQQAQYSSWQQRPESIAGFIHTGQSGVFETSSETLNRLIDRMHLKDWLGKKVWLKIAGYTAPNRLSFLESRRLMDCAFSADEKCSGCSICSRLCPVDNIELVDERPVWLHRCEQCFACLQWCPKEAIQFGSNTSHGKRYHHPDVKISDMLNQRRITL
jgi:ferredoxin